MPQPDLDAAAAEIASEIDALVARGPRARGELARLADRGDWRARVLALSALGRLVRDDATAHARLSPQAWLARVPRLRRRVASTGRHGRLVSATLANAAGDRLFIVRVAAALALGECRDPALDGVLALLQRDPFRPVRIAAGAGRVALGHGASAWPDPTDVATTPDLIADGVPTGPWLRHLSAAHHALVTSLQARTGDRASFVDVVDWLAGAGHETSRGGVAEEAARYADEADLEYQRMKPFGGADRRENLRQLDALVTLLSHLDAPRGATVLDLGGGSGWVAEVLARFGFRPVVVDVSPPLLRLARERLTAGGWQGSAVSGDMTALPLRPASVDAVIVLDALHHVGALRAVLAEVRRVLVPGGQLLVGEPGEGHSESAKSLAETAEHGVREGEVHPQAVWTAARAVGFTDGVIVPRTPASLVLPIDALPAAMRTPADAWVAHDGDTTVRFETAVVRSMLARPLLVLRNGRRVRDTRAPGALRADIRPVLTRAGAVVSGTVTVVNGGDTVWLSASPDGVGAVSVGLQLLSSNRELVAREWWRGALTADVPPGGSAVVAVDARLPDAVTAYRIKIDLVADGVCWFEDLDSRPVGVPI